MKNLLITGSTGFIGKNCLNFFDKKFTLFHPSRFELNLLDGNEVKNYLASNKIDYIIHAASVGGHRAYKGQDNIIGVNLKMFFNFAANSQFFKKMICFGSGAEFDKNKSIVNISEKEFGFPIPKDDYGFSKYVCSQYIQQQKDNKIIALRLFGIYGMYENYLIRFISNSILKNLFNQPIIIKQNVVFDYLFIDDLMKIIDHFLVKKASYPIYNTVSGEKTDLLSIAKIINSISSHPSKIIVENKNLGNEYSASNKRLLADIANIKITTIRSGITQLFQWYNLNLSAINKDEIIRDEFSKF